MLWTAPPPARKCQTAEPMKPWKQHRLGFKLLASLGGLRLFSGARADQCQMLPL